MGLFILTSLALTSQLALLTEAYESCTDSSGSECYYCLGQRDFELGTFRITEAGLYCVVEDIVFNPDPWFPANDRSYPGCERNTDGAYALGYFAAITIEVSNVVLDLNGYTISTHQSFYLKQRWGTIIEISNSPFLPKAGPAHFGSQFRNVRDVTIKNGNLGLSSHHGIHANNAQNVVIKNLNIFDFEVGAIQLNGFKNVQLSNLNIGPSLQYVPFSGYYSNAGFLRIVLDMILKRVHDKKMEMPSVSFSYLHPEESLSLRQIHDNLAVSMDLGAKEAKQQTTESDAAHPLYPVALDLFKNWDALPDGSALYGIILNSYSVAVNGFGDSPNVQSRQGEDILIEDVKIGDLKMTVNDVPAMYFDECEGKQTKTILKGPFGDVMNVRLMVDEQYRDLIDEYGQEGIDLRPLRYAGNPLSDAQIAFFLFKDIIADTFVSKSSYISHHFLKWALNDYGGSNEWPQCASFVCNGDIMFHQNKGIIGLRMDGIEKADIKNFAISNLENRSPLGTYTCASYSGPHNGGHTATQFLLDREGAMLSDVRGISLADSDVTLYGGNSISSLTSWFGDVAGIDLMQKATLMFDDKGTVVSLNYFAAATKVTQGQYAQLVQMNRTPFPNNFKLCNIAIDESSAVVDGPMILQNDDCRLADIGKAGRTQGIGLSSLSPLVSAIDAKLVSWTFLFMLVIFYFFGNRR